MPGFGDPKARMLIVGLAPAAHGANRTGRMFTGDRSGDFLYAGLHRLGFARIATSTSIDDGQKLTGAFITAPCRCAPPENKPTPAELANCAPWLDAELSILPKLRVVLALGSIGWNAALKAFARRGQVPVIDPGREADGGIAFGHGAEVKLANGPVLLGSYHVSQQNTQTGRLTEAMFDAVLTRARSLVNAAGP
ncbi:MAG: uracil-DNA glycosylase [Deltaproteobacteria bacterium]|nr:uracil-DNA glycosylase [Deltaproteobacteria bacterium]